MTALGLRPYAPGDAPAEGAVAVSVVVLTKNEAVNIERCLASVRWAEQVVVLDSGSTDDTVLLAKAAGAEVVEELWHGYGRQRELALRLPVLRHDWVYFVDADEWVSPGLAAEIAGTLRDPQHHAYAHRFRVVFLGRWIRHCGWYGGSWIVRLMRRSAVRFGDETAGERVQVDGVGRLRHDIVDHDLKGLAAWLHKHVGYAELEASRQSGAAPLAQRWRVAQRWRTFRAGRSHDTRPLLRAVAKDLVLPLVPARPLVVFCYMYLLRLGFLDGVPGLLFCLYHAWYRVTIEALHHPDATAPAR